VPSGAALFHIISGINRAFYSLFSHGLKTALDFRTDFCRSPRKPFLPRHPPRRMAPLGAQYAVALPGSISLSDGHSFVNVQIRYGCEHCSGFMPPLPYIQEDGNFAVLQEFPRSEKFCVIMMAAPSFTAKRGINMQCKLTISERMKDLRVERGLTLEQLAEATGLSRSALGKYEAEEFKDISPFSIVTLARFYGVSTDYLLGVTEQKNHPNTGLDALHLSDDAIDLLKSGKINHRLLCELITHKGFQRFLVDAEIYVDRIADMRVNDMNAILEATRQQLIQRYDVGENDLYRRTLELAQVDEDGYFAHVVHKDIDAVLRDIRDAHRPDNMTADVDSGVV